MSSPKQASSSDLELIKSDLKRNKKKEKRRKTWFNIRHFKKTKAEDILEKCDGIEDVLNVINNDGSYLWKVRSASKWFRRKFDLNIRDMHINYSPSSKNGNCFRGTDSKIDITDICEVRRGWKTDVFNKVEEHQEKTARKRTGHRPVDEACCFSVIYGERRSKTLDLVASSPEMAGKWVKAIEHLMTWYELKQLEAGYEIWLRKKFDAADTDKDKCLSFSETQKLLLDLNIEMIEGEAVQLFNMANTNSKVGRNGVEVLNEDEFMTLYFRLLRRPEIDSIFKRYLSPYGTFTATQLQNFLRNEQIGFEDVSEQECSSLLQIYEHSDAKAKGHMTPAGILNMLLSTDFEIFNYHQHRHECQDMSQPLSHYFISSSHNTYITGNQVSGKASVDAYVDSLKRGCKCVEIDCWDGDDGEPVIWHGHTFVTKISFREVLEDAIKPFAFFTSNFPLILSLEVHCSTAVRHKITSYLKEILGKMLYTEDVSNLENLPSPNELRGKILIKAKSNFSKKSKKRFVNTTTTVTYGVVSNQTLSSEATQNVTIAAASATPRSALYPYLSDSDTESDGEDIPDGSIDDPSKDLPSLVKLLSATKFSSFEESALTGKCYEMSSFSETMAQKLIKEMALEYINFNKRQISRIYPSAGRAFSSNYTPVQFWRVGCQMVSLNYQTNDLPNLVNEAMFQQNGACGYVLKPEFLRNQDPHLNQNEWFKNACVLKLRIISGQHLPKAEGNPEVVDPYVEFRVLGIGKEDHEFTTKRVHNNGFNPFWDETFEVHLKCPELTFLFFRVRDYAQSGSNVPLGYYAASFNAIRTGYSHIRLKSLSREPIPPSSLFVHITITKDCSDVGTGTVI